VREGNDYTFWVYILTSRTGTLYIGITGYIDHRISQHKMDSIEGFTKNTKSIAWSTMRPSATF
jgi:predicted GIY-YIG superfamily endonuclease